MVADMGEFDLIDRYFKPLADDAHAFGLEDDAALLPAVDRVETVVSTDTMVEGIHYFPETSAADVAAKLLRVNLSDLAAMGARPIGYTLNMCLPAGFRENWVAEFCQGLRAEQHRFGFGLLGGDTTGTSGPAVVSATIFGSVPAGRALRRNGAKAGDDIWVTGTLGDAAAAMRHLKSGGGVGDIPVFVERLNRPEPRVALGMALVGLAHAAIDLSDGLLADLGHVCRASGAGAEVLLDDLPQSPEFRALDLEAGERAVLMAASGDDYELLFTAAAGQREDILAAGRETETPVSRIGTITGGSTVRLLDGDGAPVEPPASGFRHF